jgi:hypothetical protein
MPPVPGPEFVDEVITGTKSVDEYLEANRDLKADEVEQAPKDDKKKRKPKAKR